MYSEDELGENYNLLPQKFEEIIVENPNIIAYLPTRYGPEKKAGIKILPTQNISASDFFGGKEWIPTTKPAPLFGVLRSEERRVGKEWGTRRWGDDKNKVEQEI